MAGKILGAILAVLVLAAVAAPPGSAKTAQIEDPAGDHPVPFMDFTAVSLAVVTGKSGLALETTFLLAGLVGSESRSTMTGYSFTAKVGKCDLLVRFVGYPDGAFDAAGFATTKCGESGRDVGGTYSLTENTIVVQSPLRDLKGVAVGQTMTDLAAFNSPGEACITTTPRRPRPRGTRRAATSPGLSASGHSRGCRLWVAASQRGSLLSLSVTRHPSRLVDRENGGNNQ